MSFWQWMQLLVWMANYSSLFLGMVLTFHYTCWWAVLPAGALVTGCCKIDVSLTAYYGFDACLGKCRLLINKYFILN